MPKKENKNFIDEQKNDESVVNEQDVMDSADAETGETVPVIGFVVDCGRLNVRREPKEGAKIVSVVPAGVGLTIDEGKSVDGWFSVCTESGIKGFCMKKYVAVRQ